MSKLGCRCGHIIRDQTDFLPYKASFINDTVEDNFFDDISKEINSIIEAASKGKLDQWVKDRWEGSNDWLPTAEMLISDRILSLFIDNSDTIYECEACGCLWVEEKGKNTFIPYTPESKSYEGILKEPESNA